MKETSYFKSKRDSTPLRFMQISDDSKGARLIYPDLPAFLGGNRMVFHASTGPALCHFDEKLSIRPLFHNGDRRQFRLAPDGSAIYFQSNPSSESGRLVIERMDADTLKMEEIFSADGFLPGTRVPVSRFGLQTVSSDGQRLAGGSWLGDGNQADAPFGIVVLDLNSHSAHVVAEDRDFVNLHLQYCRSREKGASHDLMLQMNHGSHTEPTGKVTCALGPPVEGGCDIHVVQDDGSNWRDLPWGRDGRESCIGHQIWRGEGNSAVTITLQNQDTSYGWADGTRQEIVAGWPVSAGREEHRGRLHRGARRVVLSKGFRHSRFCHLNGDQMGLRFVFDTFPIFDGERAGMHLYIGWAADMQAPLRFQYLANSGVTFNAANGYHAHPIVSPDGKWVLFNSNVSGRPQIYGITGFEWN